jgi:uncharacterized protein (TIGR02466 family)
MNEILRTEINALLAPRPAIPLGSNWQTQQDLHTLDAFQPFVAMMKKSARGAMRWLGLGNHETVITGCWANISPKGGHHPGHRHPNNLISAVYYVDGGTEINFSDPRPSAQMIMPLPNRPGQRNSNSISVDAVTGRVVMFPSWLRHHVGVNAGETERISIATNFMIPNYTEAAGAPLWTPTPWTRKPDTGKPRRGRAQGAGKTAAPGKKSRRF